MSFEHLKRWDERLSLCLQSNIDLITKTLPSIKNKIFFDIGCNTGLITDCVCKNFPDWNVYAFEPVRDLYSYCNSKFVNNSNIKIYNIGFSNFIGEDFISKDNDNLGYNTVSSVAKYGEQERIKLNTLDSFVTENNIKNIGFIKIDVECYESFVIEGAKTYLNNTNELPYILMEIGNRPNSELWVKEIKMFEFLFDVGYKRFDYQNKFDTYDVLFEPVLKHE